MYKTRNDLRSMGWLSILLLMGLNVYAADQLDVHEEVKAQSQTWATSIFFDLPLEIQFKISAYVLHDTCKKYPRLFNEIMLKQLKGHEKSVHPVVFNYDGTQIASASSDTTVRLWDVYTGRQIHVLQGHDKPVSSVAFSPDGTQIVSASYGTVRIWDALYGKQMLILKHNGRVNSVTFNHDGTYIISAGEDKAIRIWHVVTGQNIRILSGHETYISVASFNHDGTRIVSADFNKTIRLWNAITGESIRTWHGHRKLVNSVMFNHDDTQILSASCDGTVRLWDAFTGQEIMMIDVKKNGMFAWSAIFNHDGSHIISANYREVRLWDAHTGQPQQVFTPPDNDKVQSVAFNYDSTQFVSGSIGKKLYLWTLPLKDAKCIRDIRLEHALWIDLECSMIKQVNTQDQTINNNVTQEVKKEQIIRKLAVERSIHPAIVAHLNAQRCNQIKLV